MTYGDMESLVDDDDDENLSATMEFKASPLLHENRVSLISAASTKLKQLQQKTS